MKSSRRSMVFLIALVVGAFFAVGYFFFTALQEPQETQVSPQAVPPSAKQAPKRVALLTTTDTQLETIEGIKAGMKELGWNADVNVKFEVYNPAGDRELLKKMAQDIVASKPDLLVPTSTTATKALEKASEGTGTQIVFIDIGNFQEIGIANPQRPGGRMTGVVKDNVEVGAKRIELLRTLLPNAKTMAMFVNPEHINHAASTAVYEEAAKTFGFVIKAYPVTKKDQFKDAMAKVLSDKPDVFFVAPLNPIGDLSEDIVKALRPAKIPSMSAAPENGVEIGHLIMFGSYRFDNGRQGARLINKVLNGQNPGDIPIETASNPKLELNLTVAEEFGIKIPESLLIRADKAYREK